MIDEDPAAPEPVERGDAQPWLGRLTNAEKEFDKWQHAADNIDKLYADLDHLRHNGRDKEFQLFWSNIQVLGPSIYARPPVPVVTPKFKDRRPLYRTASEMLERACVVSFDVADIDQHMLALRDDLAIVGRGVPWVSYEDDGAQEKVCYEHLDRKDFLHEPARKWADVGWVAKRAWLTPDEMRKRFKEAADDVPYSSRRDDKGVSNVQKCGVWEIWSKTEEKVVWVVEGCQKVLDEGEPHLKLTGFFPCPRPAYATVQRRSLVPVPDMLVYKDQLEEVNALTRRIHALQWAIKVRGFYSGEGDIGKAIERAIQSTDDDSLLIPIPNLQSLMQGSGDPIIWLPIEVIAQTIQGLVELRRQLFEDVYQIIGLSDIMRGMTDSSETATAQRFKQQNGSYRVRDKQNELIRVARDMVRIGAEIMAEEFSEDTLIDMAQMDLPTDAEVQEQLEDLRKKAKEELNGLAEKAEQMAAQAQQQGQEVDPAQAEQQFQAEQQKIVQKWSQQIKQAGEQVTIDQVMAFFKDEKLRPYVLDIETDSTIYPDEDAEKASRAEFMQAFASTMSSVMPMLALGPEAVSVAGGMVKFALSPYRVGRELEGLIDDFVDQGPQIAERMQQQASKGESEEMAQASLKLAEAEGRKAEAAIMKVQADTQAKQQEMSLKAAEAEAKARADQQRISLEMEDTRGDIAKTQADIQKIMAEIQKMGADVSNQTRQQDREDVKAAADIQGQQQDRAMAAQDRQRQALESDRDAEMSERQQSFSEEQGERQQTLAERQAEKESRDG